jgi:hypothetical protein
LRKNDDGALGCKSAVKIKSSPREPPGNINLADVVQKLFSGLFKFPKESREIMPIVTVAPATMVRFASETIDFEAHVSPLKTITSTAFNWHLDAKDELLMDNAFMSESVTMKKMKLVLFEGNHSMSTVLTVIEGRMTILATPELLKVKRVNKPCDPIHILGVEPSVVFNFTK